MYECVRGILTNDMHMLCTSIKLHNLNAASLKLRFNASLLM